MLGRLRIRPGSHLHFVGIGGAGMSGLAMVMRQGGHAVSGSDLVLSEATRRLAEAGARLYQGHSAENVGDAELVVVSSAIPADNTEVTWARQQRIPVVKRAELLGELTRRQRTIAVAGTHGKSTTNAMIAVILTRAGLEPTVLVGGEPINPEGSAKLGRGRYLVAEADEFDGSFLYILPWMAVVTNVEADHLDFYRDIEAVSEAFARFIGLVPPDGHLVACADDPRLRGLAGVCAGHVATYGLEAAAEWRATALQPNRWGGNSFCVVRGDVQVGQVHLQVPGRHNVANALAAFTAAALVGVEAGRVCAALRDFRGVGRRFQHKGTVGGIAIYDDYAHHPTEIRATLQAARERHQGRLWAVFQPHTYNRTQRLLSDFATSFGLADRVIVTDIFSPPGREKGPGGVSSADLVCQMVHPGAEYLGPLEAVVERLCISLQEGDMLLTMGAGDIYAVGERVLERLRVGARQ